MSTRSSDNPGATRTKEKIVVQLADGIGLKIELDIASGLPPELPRAYTASVKQLAETLAERGRLWADDPGAGARVMQSAADFGELVTRGIEAPRASYGKLPKRRRAVVMRSMADIAETLAEAALVEDIEVKDLAARARVASDTFRLITKASPGQVQALSDALAPIVELDPAQTTDDDAEAVGRLLMRQLHERLVRQSYSVRELAEVGLSRQRLNQLRKEDKLFALRLPYKRSLLYPRWQFDDALRPRPEMPELIATADKAELDPVDFHVLMTNVEAGDGVAPVELLNSGQRDLVLNILAAANAHGA